LACSFESFNILDELLGCGHGVKTYGHAAFDMSLAEYFFDLIYSVLHCGVMPAAQIDGQFPVAKPP
jgi:hypothetical protein